MHIFRIPKRFGVTSQGHFIAFNADLYSMGRSAFLPDVCELPHLFVQSTDPFLSAGLELEIKIKISLRKGVGGVEVIFLKRGQSTRA